MLLNSEREQILFFLRNLFFNVVVDLEPVEVFENLIKLLQTVLSVGTLGIFFNSWVKWVYLLHQDHDLSILLGKLDSVREIIHDNLLEPHWVHDHIKVKIKVLLDPIGGERRKVEVFELDLDFLGISFVV